MIRLALLLFATATILSAQSSSVFYLSGIEVSFGIAGDGKPICAASMPDGGYFVCYSTRKGGFIFNSMGVMRLRPDGSVEWSRNVDIFDERAVSNRTEDGHPLNGLTATTILRTADGNYIVTASNLNEENGYESGVVLLTFSPHGELVGIRSHMTALDGRVVAHRLLDAGSIAIVNGVHDSRLVWFDALGEIVAQRSYRRPEEKSDFFLHDIQIDSTGSLVVVGTLDLARFIDDDAMSDSIIEAGIIRPPAGVVLRLDRAGNVRDGRLLTANDGIEPLAVETMSDGRFLIAGATTHGDSLPHPFHLTLNTNLSADERAGSREYGDLGSFSGIGRLSDGTVMITSTSWYDDKRDRIVYGDGYVHIAADGSVIDARHVGALPIVPGLNDEPVRSGRGDNDTINPPPSGVIAPVGFTPGAGETGLFFGTDESSIPIFAHYSPSAPLPCFESSDDARLDSLTLTFELTPVLIKANIIDITSPDEPSLTSIRTQEQRLTLSPVCPDGSFPRPTSVRPDNESDLAIEPTRNVIRRGEQIELDVHIERSSETTFAITLAFAQTGDISAEQRSSFAAPFHEPVYVPTTGLAPGLYMVVLKVGDREVGAKVQIVP